MNKLIFGTWRFSTVLLACVVLGASSTHGQQTAEQYIPIGHSPGISGKYSYIGNIVSVDRRARTISVQDRGVLRAIEVTNETRIWLDRSKIRRENILADYDDCEVGRRIEVMYSGDDKKSAGWIKIESG